MFKRVAAEAFGLSDVGVIITPEDYSKVDADDYLFHEDNEKIFFLIKSKKDEYCFTNLALIHVDGDSAISSKRMIKRYEYSSYAISHVAIETAGTVDLDVELKFTINGNINFSIDVKKSFLEPLKDIYKALHTIGKQQRKDEMARENAIRCLNAVSSMNKMSIVHEDSVVSHYSKLLEALNDTLFIKHTTRDFTAVFEKYIHN